MVSAAYIHIPFCKQICHYCDYNKVFIENQPVDAYLDALEREMILTKATYPSTYMKSIFVGGGTPTSLSEQQLARLVTIIQTHLPFNEETEYTFEANPDRLSVEKLRVLKKGGVNRLSFGVQTLNDDILAQIGRSHRAAEAIQTIERAAEEGFTNISIDLMFGLPNQTLADLEASLQTALQLPIKHLSCYALVVQPKTVFYNLLQKDELPLPTEDEEADMYELLMDFIEKSPFHQYEISSFSLPQFESRHNLTYWSNEQYYGFGASAHSYLGGVRRGNVAPLNKYIEMIQTGNLPTQESTVVSREEQIEEELFLGLRKNKGVSLAIFSEKYGCDVHDLYEEETTQHKRDGLLEIKDGYLYLTRKGRLLGNLVFQSFIRKR